MVQDKTVLVSTSLEKALRVLFALENSPDGRGVSEIAREIGIQKSAVHRLLATFQQHGVVQKQQKGGSYTLGPTLARLGLRAANMFTPRLIAHPHLEALASEIGETVFLGVLAQDHVLIIDKVEPEHILRISPQMGIPLPIHQTALGKLLLAFQESPEQERLLATFIGSGNVETNDGWRMQLRQEINDIALKGFAVSLETWAPGIFCLAAPVRDRQGTTSAALAIALPSSRMPYTITHDPFSNAGQTQPPALVTALITTAKRITEDML